MNFNLLLIDLGMSGALARILIDHKDDQFSAAYGTVIQTGFVVLLVQGIVLAAVGALVSLWLPQWMNVPVRHWHVFRVLVIWQCITSLGTQADGVNFSPVTWGDSQAGETICQRFANRHTINGKRTAIRRRSTGTALRIRKKSLVGEPILIKEVRIHHPLALRTVPWLARYYRFAFHTRITRRVTDLLLYLPLRKLFPVCRALGFLPRRGTFEYERLGSTSTVQFDAANIQYQALYGQVYECGYEQEVGLLIDGLLPEGGTFYDVGSNWGYFTLYAASRRAQVAIHAFEPFPGSMQDLRSCVQQAGLSKVVSCHALALSSTDGEAFIHVPDRLLSGTARLTGDAGGTRIITRRLDGLNLPPPDFIKIDVEGHEAQVLQGGLETLKSSWPFIAFENIRDYSDPAKTLEPLLILANLGYHLYIPSVRMKYTRADYFLPCGWQMDVRRIQPIRDHDWLALSPFEPSTRYLFQNDVNIFACHESRRSKLISAFQEWRPLGTKDA